MEYMSYALIRSMQVTNSQNLQGDQKLIPSTVTKWLDYIITARLPTLFNIAIWETHYTRIRLHCKSTQMRDNQLY